MSDRLGVTVLCKTTGSIFLLSHFLWFIFNEEALIPEVSDNEFPSIPSMLAWMRDLKEQCLLSLLQPNFFSHSMQSQKMRLLCSRGNLLSLGSLHISTKVMFHLRTPLPSSRPPRCFPPHTHSSTPIHFLFKFTKWLKMQL